MPPQDQERPVHVPAPLHLHNAPEDMAARITNLPRLRGPSVVWKKVMTMVSHCALFAIAPQGRPPGIREEGDDDVGYGEMEAEGEKEGEWMVENASAVGEA